jgi:hypothetical protein
MESKMHSKISEALAGRKFWLVLGILGVILLLAGSVYSADWMTYFTGASALYPAIAKPCITLLAFVLVLITGRNRLEKRDWQLLLLAFLCMLPTDILMSIVVVSPTLSVGGWVFMVGGILSIIAHVFLIIRVGRGLKYLKHFKLREAWLPVLVYGVALAALLILWKDVVRVGHAVLGPVYTAFFCTTMWFSWETLRRGLYPKINAWMVSIAATCWFATEIFGEVYNLGLGNISEVFFRWVWVFYGANVVLWALSGYRWQDKHIKAAKST